MKKLSPPTALTPLASLYGPVVLDPTADAIDENLLLAETEELLAALDATAFIASPLSTEDDEEGDEGDAEYESESSPVLKDELLTPTPASDAAPLVAPPMKTGVLTTPKKRIRSRDRTKDELIELRRSVVEMEQHLVALRRSTLVVGKGRVAITKTWENIAKRQLHDRQRAEAENQNLKAMLLGQLSLAGRFDQMSNKRQLVALPNLPCSPEAQTKRARIASDYSEGMEALVGDLDRHYGELDAVFKECGLDQWSHETKSYAQTKVETAGDLGETRSFIELVDMRMIPFPVHAVGNYLWQSMKIWHHKNSTYTYACHDRPEDTFAVSYRVKAAANGDEDKYSASFKLVKRRYMRENELVVIWKSRSDGENELYGYYTDEVGWIVVSHVPSVDDTTPATTVLRACLHIYPRKAATGPATDAVDLAGDDYAVISIKEDTTAAASEPISRKMRLTNLVVGSFEDDVNSINQTMENLLLEEARALEQHVDESATGLAKTTRIQFASTK